MATACGNTMSTRPISAKASPYSTLMDETVTIEVAGLLPKQNITLRSFFDDEGKQFESYAHYISDDDGDVNTTSQTSHGGLYTGIEPMGLFWSMVACPGHKRGTRYMKHDVTNQLVVNISVHNGHLDDNQVRPSTPMAATSVERWYMGKNVELIKVNAGRIRGSLLKPKGPGPYPAVVDMFGGVRPGCNEIRAALLASRGYATLALAYFGGEGQPRWLDDVDVLEMEYFEEAVDWLSSQSFVQPGGVGSIGVCKGGEMAMAMAIHFPEKIIATVGISAAGIFSVCPTSYRGETYPYSSYDDDDSARISFTSSGAIITKDVEEKDNYDNFQKFENIRCPVLIICGEDDSSVHNNNSREIARKIKTNGRNNECQLIVYPGAGHLIEPPNAPICTACYQPPWGLMQWGGIPADHARAQVATWEKILNFLKINMEQDRNILSKL